METSLTVQPKQKKEHFGWIMVLYLLGLFIGAIGTGSITPVRTIIQNSLDVSDQTGICMITIYTLCYAAIIPVSGKLADRHGRKIVFLISIFLFGAGSVICGISAGMSSFAVLLVGRVISAIGAGGIMPIATAEFGTSFPPEKRGMALGMVGGVYGIGNVLGATAGSAILDIFGDGQWQWIFYINVPICVFIIIGGLIYIPNHKSEQVFKIDKLGTLLITVIILSLLYGLKNLDFFDFFNSIASRDVWLYLLIAAVLIPIFVFVEKRAEDPVFHIEYMKNSQIVLTLAMGMLVGCSMMGMIFIPQFAENCLKISSGAGGYFVIILGVMAGAVSPISGNLIDKFGSKPVLGAGFIVSAIGALYISFVAVHWMNWFNIIVSLLLIGLGMGLAIGTPLNYMMMRHTKEEDSNSALATLSLLRSIGTAIAPAIMVGFIAQAGATMQDDLMKEMPKLPEVPKMEQQVELEAVIDKLKESDEFQKQMDENNIDIDEMLNMNMDMDIDMSKMSKEGDVEIPDKLLKELQNSDVTNITVACKDMAQYFYDEYTPDVIEDIQGGIGEGIDGIGEGINGITDGINGIQDGIKGIDSGRAGIKKGINGITKGIKGIQSGIKEMDGKISDMQSGISGIQSGITGMQQALDGMNQGIAAIEAIPGWETNPTMKQQHDDLVVQRDDMQAKIDKAKNDISGMEQGIAGMESGKDSMKAKIKKMKSQRSDMWASYNKMGKAKSDMQDAIAEMEDQRDLMIQARELMQSMSDDIPEVFADVEEEYMESIDDNSDKIEAAFQKKLNEGFKNMYICVAIFNVIGLLLLLFYRDDRRRENEE